MNMLKLDLRKLDWRRMDLVKPQPGASLLGLALDSGRLEGVALRRTNGAVEIRKTFAVSLSLDPLTDEPELVGREIRKQLDAAGIRERRCAVCVPLQWALTLTTKLPELAEADLKSFLAIEAERGFPYGPEELMLSQSCYCTPAGERYATLVAIPRDHLARLEAALQAAQLRPVSFSLGIAALQRPEAGSSLRTGGPAGPEADGVIALAPGENHVNLQVSCGGGAAVLRTVDGAFELEGSEKRLQADHVARELRITLGQLPPELRQTLRRLRVFGAGDAADELAEQIRPRVEAWGMKVEQVREYEADEFGIKLPARTAVSPALSLALGYLTGGGLPARGAPAGAGLEFLPPKVSPWRQFATRYSSRKLAWAGAAGGAVVLTIALAFLVQQAQLIYWGSKWNAMAPRVTELENMQQQIKKYRPWFDESFRSLSILRRLTEAFPQDGAVSARTVEIRGPTAVSCSGTARDNQALLKTLDQLRAAREVRDVKVEQIRGKSPMQFTFNFHWGEGAGQ